MDKTIRISCETGSYLNYDDLVIIQGDLKSLSDKNYEKLKRQIIKEGFDAPFFIWKGTGDYKNKFCILDGTQRYRTLGKMRDDGYTLPKFPVAWILAKTYKEAKRKLLGFVSQYGKLEKQGMYEFLADSDITIKDLDDYHFPEVRMDKFKMEYFEDLQETQIPYINDTDKQYIVAIECESEDQMNKLYEELKERGLECKLIT